MTQATRRIGRQIEAQKPAAPLRFLLMSSVSVHRDRAHGRRRGLFRRAFLWLVRTLVPPAPDNQRAADFLIQQIGSDSAFMERVAVRPDTLLDGLVSQDTLSRDLTHRVLAPASTQRANIAHFLCELLSDPATWAAWKGTLPAITNAPNKGT